MNEMRTNDEMLKIYKLHESEGRVGQPYILHYYVGDCNLTFFGSVHTADPESPQWNILEDEWSKFTKSENPKKILIFEKSGSNVDGLDRRGAIIEHGETGLALWLAEKNSVDTLSPQRSNADAIKTLQAQGYTTKEIMTYYFARQMHQWARQDKEIAPNWELYMEDTIKHYNDLDCWGEDLSLVKTLDWFVEESGKEFDEHDISTFYNISDPSQNPVSAESGKQQDIALHNEIQKQISLGKDVFVVYGSGHAIRLEPVLDDEYQKTVIKSE